MRAMWKKPIPYCIHPPFPRSIPTHTQRILHNNNKVWMDGTWHLGHTKRRASFSHQWMPSCRLSLQAMQLSVGTSLRLFPLVSTFPYAQSLGSKTQCFCASHVTRKIRHCSCAIERANDDIFWSAKRYQSEAAARVYSARIHVEINRSVSGVGDTTRSFVFLQRERERAIELLACVPNERGRIAPPRRRELDIHVIVVVDGSLALHATF